MRILFITHYASNLGANWSLFHLARALRDRHGAAVMIWMPRQGAFADLLRQEGIPYRVLPFANWAYTMRSLGFWFFPLRWRQTLNRLDAWTLAAADWKPDIVHSNSAVASLGALLADKLKVPHIWHFREFAWLHYRFFFLTGKKFVHQFHEKATAFIAISNALKKSELAHVKQPVYTIYDGIGKAETIASWRDKRQEKNSATPFTFIKIGLLHPSKNQMEALAAFRKVHQSAPTARLLIVGNGRRLYAWRLKWYIWRHCLQKAVTLTGYLPNPAQAFAQSDALLMCSRYEAMGRVVLEAMAYELPVIGYNSGATPELVAHKERGLIYNTPQELEAAMRELIDNPERARQLGKGGRSYVLEHFTDEISAARIWQVYVQHKKTS